MTCRPTKTSPYCNASSRAQGSVWLGGSPPRGDETFTTALKGGFVAIISKNNVRQYFKLENSEEQTQILVTSADSDFVDALYSEAKRKAFNGDKAIADIIRSGS